MAKGEPMAIFLNIKRQRALSSVKKAKPATPPAPLPQVADKYQTRKARG